MPSQSIYFSKFSGRGMPQTPTIGKLYMLIVLCAITSYSQSNALLYLCDHTRFRKTSRKLPMGMMYFEYLCIYISDCAPPLWNPWIRPCLVSSYMCETRRRRRRQRNECISQSIIDHSTLISYSRDWQRKLWLLNSLEQVDIIISKNQALQI